MDALFQFFPAHYGTHRVAATLHFSEDRLRERDRSCGALAPAECHSFQSWAAAPATVGAALGCSHTSSISCVSDNSMSAAPRLFERLSSVLKDAYGLHHPESWPYFGEKNTPVKHRIGHEARYATIQELRSASESAQRRESLSQLRRYLCGMESTSPILDPMEMRASLPTWRMRRKRRAGMASFSGTRCRSRP